MKNIYNEIKALSPVPIYEVDIQKFCKKYGKYDKRYSLEQKAKEFGKESSISGYYIPHIFNVPSSCFYYNKKFILIEKSLNKFEKLRVLLHEIGHSLDLNLNNKSYNERELEAEMYALRQILKIKSKEIAKYFMEKYENKRKDFTVAFDLPYGSENLILNDDGYLNKIVATKEYKQLKRMLNNVK